MPLLTIEIFESTARSTAAPALARTADLRTYAVAQEAWLFWKGRWIDRERQDKPEWLRVFFSRRMVWVRGFYFFVFVQFFVCMLSSMSNEYGVPTTQSSWLFKAHQWDTILAVEDLETEEMTLIQWSYSSSFRSASWCLLVLQTAEKKYAEMDG